MRIEFLIKQWDKLKQTMIYEKINNRDQEIILFPDVGYSTKGTIPYV